MEKPSKETRTNYPAELRSAGIELVISLIAQHRFDLDLKLKDMTLRKEMLTLVFKDHQQSYTTQVEAVSTHDGYFTVWLPANLRSSLMLGEKYRWLQIESMEYIHMEGFVHQIESKKTIDAFNKLIFVNMKEQTERIYELADDSHLSIPPFTRLDSPTPIADFVLRIVFRPLAKSKQLTQPSVGEQRGLQTENTIY